MKKKLYENENPNAKNNLDLFNQIINLVLFYIKSIYWTFMAPEYFDF